MSNSHAPTFQYSMGKFLRGSPGLYEEILGANLRIYESTNQPFADSPIRRFADLFIHGGPFPKGGRSCVSILLLSAALLWGCAGRTGGEAARQITPPPSQEATPMKALNVGDVAPDFTLPSGDGTPITLSSFRGKKNVVLAFYVLNFTGG